MFRTVPLSIVRSFSLSTQQWYMSYRFADSLRTGLGRNHTAMVYVTQVCWQLASRIRMELVPSWSCSQAVSKPVWHIPLLCVQWKAPDDWRRNCPKHAEFYSKNKFKKLVHLVGFIIRIYHDARSPERQNTLFVFTSYCHCFLSGGAGSSNCHWKEFDDVSC